MDLSRKRIETRVLADIERRKDQLRHLTDQELLDLHHQNMNQLARQQSPVSHIHDWGSLCQRLDALLQSIHQLGE